MRYQLKYLVPLLIFILGFSVMGINIFFYAMQEHQQKVVLSKERISIMGNRISSEIEHDQLYGKNSFAELTRLFSQYALEHLNIAIIYNDQGEEVFKSIPVKYLKDASTKYKKKRMEVSKEKKSYLYSNEEDMKIEAIFPLAMPLEQGELYAKSYGTLYLEFDMSYEHENLKENLYKYFIINGLIILLMVSVLALLLYFLILKRVSADRKSVV